MAPVDPTCDPLPTARTAIDRDDAIVHEDAVFRARALVHAHEKIDQLYAALEKGSDATRSIVEQVLRGIASWSPSTAACVTYGARSVPRLIAVPCTRSITISSVLTGSPRGKIRCWTARGRINNESVSLRDVIDWLMPAEAQESSTCA
jgi:hypothetical protein